LSTVLLEGI